MFALGLAAGAAEEVTRGQERIRQRMDQQLQEAREYSKLAKKREAEAAAVKQDIQNTSRSYGIDPKVLFSAYRNGHYDQYKGLIEEVRKESALRGTSVDAATLQGLYEVPQSVLDENVDVDTEINRIFGVIKQGLPEVEADDVGIGQLLLRGLGVDDGKGLERRTVGGYGVNQLLDMPNPQTPRGDGGRINAQAYRMSERPRSGGETFNANQIATMAGKSAAVEITRRMGVEGATSEAAARVEARVTADIARRLEENPGTSLAEIMDAMPMIVDSYQITTEDGKTYIDTFRTAPDSGERIFIQLDDTGTAVPGTRVPESQLRRAPAQPRAQTGSAVETTPLPATATPIGAPVTGTAPPVIEHPQFGTLRLVSERDGIVRYMDDNGKFYSTDTNR